MSRKKKASKKGARAGAKGKQKGLLSRLFGRDGGPDSTATPPRKKGGTAGAGKAAPGEAEANGKKPSRLSPLERSIQEIKHMAKVGESDPERLAMLLSRLLTKEREKKRRAQEDFERMVWDLVKRDEAAGGEADGGPAADGRT